MPGFLAFVGRRLARVLVSLAAVSVITFTLLQAAPGTFADIARITSGATGIGGAVASETTAALQSRYGADIPPWEQYLIFMRGALTWDMGPSYKYPQLSVEQIIAAAFPVSATLASAAVIVSLVIAVPLGVLAALRRNSVWDYGTMFTVTLGNTLPSYLAAVILILILAATFQLLPIRGWSGPEHMIMPVLALALGPAAVLARYVRSSMLETLREEYIVAARAKGGPERTIIVRHALRNSLIPLVTVLGPLLAQLAVGTVFVETIFGIPGLGLYFTGAAISRDMPLLMGATLFFAVILMVTNLLVDLTYGVLDPRIRAQHAGALPEQDETATDEARPTLAEDARA